MSEYGFDDGFEPDGMSGAGEPQSNGQQGPKWFRDYMDKVSGQLSELKAENDRLKEAQKRSQVEDTLKAKGYAPQAAGLYTGDPAKLDEWLTANGSALAKLPDAPSEGQTGEQAPQGPPASTVPADGQERLQRMQEQGTQGVAPPQGTDNEVAAALQAADPEAFVKLMQSHGNAFDWRGFSS